MFAKQIGQDNSEFNGRGNMQLRFGGFRKYDWPEGVMRTVDRAKSSGFHIALNITIA